MMTNVSKTPEKVELRKRLWDVGVETLRAQGWNVERMSGTGKSSLRRIAKGGVSKVATIRTTQDRWFAFPRTSDDKGWLTLDDADVVIVISVDDKEAPKSAWVHMFEQADIRRRFDRAYQARTKAKRQLQKERGVWISLYDEDDGSTKFVGAGAGREEASRIAMVPLKKVAPASSSMLPVGASGDSSVRPLSINEAKQGLALTFGVDVSRIRITVEA